VKRRRTTKKREERRGKKIFKLRDSEENLWVVSAKQNRWNRLDLFQQKAQPREDHCLREQKW
jgi:hypothetical protein